VRVLAADGSMLGIAHFNPHTLIAARMLNTYVEAIDQSFWEKHIALALAMREKLFDKPFYRLIHAEADLCPGLIIDRYGDVIVMQANTAGMNAARNEIVAALDVVLKPKTILLRGDNPSRVLERLPEEVVLLKGDAPAGLDVYENGLTYRADIAGGQKTGWFYDQRANRAMVAKLAKGRTMIDMYTHTGGFGLCAAYAGAREVLCVDRSEHSLALAKKSANKQGFAQVQFEQAEIFEFCEKQSKNKKYDVVVADPPAFAKSKKDVSAASRGYRKLATYCAQMTEKGGFLFIASCSHAINRERFDEEVLRGISDAKRHARILARTAADMDHPTHPHLPESAYLKGIMVHVD
jgi:23S rRNA (cytosine1962-C5)-methyltransferase